MDDTFYRETFDRSDSDFQFIKVLFYLLLAVLVIIAFVGFIMFAARKDQKLQHGKLVQICRGVTQTYKVIWICPLVQAVFMVGFCALQIYLLILCYFSGSFDARMSKFGFSVIGDSEK